MALGRGLRQPVFVIGTGRCGTSLLSSILDSHNQILGFPEEANELWHPKSYPFRTRTIETPAIVENPQEFTSVSISHWPRNHELKLQNTFTGYHFAKGRDKIFFVKSAMISFMIPRILAIFPGARFIHIFRFGPAVVDSLMKKEWKKYGNYFDSRREYQIYCAKYWRDCLLEIEKRKTQISLESSNAFLEIRYERLCEYTSEVLDELGSFLSISAKDFAFDTREVNSRNMKPGAYLENEEWAELLHVMAPALTLKKYR